MLPDDMHSLGWVRVTCVCHFAHFTAFNTSVKLIRLLPDCLSFRRAGYSRGMTHRTGGLPEGGAEPSICRVKAESAMPQAAGVRARNCPCNPRRPCVWDCRELTCVSDLSGSGPMWAAQPES